MGEAKRRSVGQNDIVWHHTSSLRTNFIWMAGELVPEGKMPDVLHPKLGLIRTDAAQRRPMKDFGPLVWLTSKIEVPRTLLHAAFLMIDKDTGAEIDRVSDTQLSNAIALQRLALGFRMSEISAISWPSHPGFNTSEGKELNESATEAGDDPNDWFVCETPVDILKCVEVRVSKSIMRPKLGRLPAYLDKIHRMVRLCKENEGVYIPPSWLSVEQAKALSGRLRVPVANLDQF